MQLRQYFDHPLELSKILIVERLIEKLPADERAKAVQLMVQSVLSVTPSNEAPKAAPAN